jgi:hypothetical protein
VHLAFGALGKGFEVDESVVEEVDDSIRSLGMK